MLRYNPRLKGRARSLRANLTDAEQRLWARLRRKQILGVRFYRQKPIGNYIADFYAPAAWLVVEVDGSQHFEAPQAEQDRRRTAYLKALGLRVLRYTDRQVLLELDSVTQEIFRAVEEKIPLNPPLQKGGISYTQSLVSHTSLLLPLL
ncbi:MAG TPA: endonuclease domain-containing protein [Candidatus Binatia bacterium]|nr:endonuclease domain-containing protein [Candidatus Binatia bacterium]